MRTVLICHEGADLNRIGIARWLASFSDLVGIVALRETKQQLVRRIRREIKRVGVARFLDVLAFRLYYGLLLAKTDTLWSKQMLQELCDRYPGIPEGTTIVNTHSPNTSEARDFIRRLQPELVVARCKMLLKEELFSIPRKGTFVFHPGICPEYRNAHGAFWALAEDDLEKVGMTLLRIDKGIDTGPVYGYYTYTYDEVRESPMVIQLRVVLDNLDALREKLEAIYRGEAVPIDTKGRPSATWGQPWLSRYLAWKRRAKKRAS